MSSDNKEKIGDRLRHERERLRMSQTAFGEMGGVKQRAQVNYESGMRSPDLEYLAAIALLGVDIYYVITGKRVYPDEPVFKEQRERDLLDNFRGSAEPEKDALLRLSAASRYMNGDKEKRRQESKAIEQQQEQQVNPAAPRYTVDFGNAQIGQAAAGDIKNETPFKNTNKRK